MGTFTCFGCGKKMDMAEYEEHKKTCGKFGQRNCVLETPIFSGPSDDYLKRNEIKALARDSEFNEKWGGWFGNK